MSDYLAKPIRERSMSDYKVPYTKILDIQPHFNAERLEVATIYGFQVITQKGKYKVGDGVVYVPIDSILPQTLEDCLFPADSKIRLNNHRVRQIRIRGLASQGMIVDPALFGWTSYVQDEDLSHELGITKYEPPVTGSVQVQGGKRNRSKAADHPLFHKYNGLDNIKWFPDLFKQGEWVVVQEKLHGTNARASILPYVANTAWKRLLKWCRLSPQYEKHYGSNNVQISGKVQGIAAHLLRLFGVTVGTYTGYYGEDTYGACFRKLDVFSKLRPGEIVYGEIIGPGIQANYTYSLKEHKFYLFDVKIHNLDGTHRYLSPVEVRDYAKERGFDLVPIIYKGEFDKQKAYELTKGPSILDPGTKVREGIVIKAVENYSDERGNKRALKWVSEEYLDDKSNSDEH